MMLILWYSALREMSVVIDPAPAIRGKAKGTIGDVSANWGSCLKISIFKTISRPRKNIMIPPATAKD